MIVLVQVLEEGEPKTVSTVGKKRIRRVEDILNKKPCNYTWGSLDIDEFIQKITQEGITDAKVEQVPSGYIIHLVRNHNTLLVHRLFNYSESTGA
jgi:glutaredoxin 2